MPDNNATNAAVAIDQAAYLIRKSYPMAAELTFRFGGNPKVLRLSTLYNAGQRDIWCIEDKHSDQLHSQEDIVDWLRRAMDYTHPELPPYVTPALGYGEGMYRLNIQKALLAQASPYATVTMVLVGLGYDWHPEQLPDLGSEDLAALLACGGAVPMFASFEAGISEAAQRLGADPSGWPDRAELRQMLDARLAAPPVGATDEEDMATRWRPTAAQIAVAKAMLHAEPDGVHVVVPAVLLGKAHGWWDRLDVQKVEPVPGFWLVTDPAAPGHDHSAARNAALAAAEAQLGDRPGQPGFFVILRNGTYEPNEGHEPRPPAVAFDRERAYAWLDEPTDVDLGHGGRTPAEEHDVADPDSPWLAQDWGTDTQINAIIDLVELAFDTGLLALPDGVDDVRGVRLMDEHGVLAGLAVTVDLTAGLRLVSGDNWPKPGGEPAALWPADFTERVGRHAAVDCLESLVRGVNALLAKYQAVVKRGGNG